MVTYSAMLGDDRCECVDTGCPANHSNQCPNIATVTLWRVDMEDITGTRFCDECADDAMESGLFTDEYDEDEDEESEIENVEA
jgi:hypothetical protein